MGSEMCIRDRLEPKEIILTGIDELGKRLNEFKEKLGNLKKE